METSRERSGFTLIELLVVLTVVGFLAAILYPVFIRAREQGRRAACLSNERQLGAALLLYVADHDETFPQTIYFSSSGTWVMQAFPYFRNVRLLRCPTDATPDCPWDDEPTQYTDSYGMNSNLAGMSVALRHVRRVYEQAATMAALAAPTKTVLLFEVSHSVTGIVPVKLPLGNLATLGNGAHYGNWPPTFERAMPDTYPDGNGGIAGESADDILPVPFYATGNIGGRVLNGGNGSVPRHNGGANYVACDDHVAWLRPEQVSGGDSQPGGGSACGQDDIRAGCGGKNTAAGTGNDQYTLTFSRR